MIDPKVAFWFGVFTTICIGIGGGAVNLTNAIPTHWIPIVVAWSSLLAFVGSTVQTAMAGYSSNKMGPLVK